jgi:hypothetical protein
MFRSTDLWVMGPVRFHCATLRSIQQVDWKPVLLNFRQFECPSSSRMHIVSSNLIGHRTLVEPLSEWSIAAETDNPIAGMWSEVSTGQYDYD